MSSETTQDVGAACATISIAFENKANEILQPVFLRESLNRWSVIAMILPDGFIDYKEVKKYKKRNKQFEFRLEIDHQAFLEGNYRQKLHLFANMLRCSVDLMTEFPAAGVTREEQDFLISVVDRVEAELLANPVSPD